MFSDENKKDVQQFEQSDSISTDDLIFMIGDKETIILSKNKKIDSMNVQLKLLSNKLADMNKIKNEELENDKNELEKEKNGLEKEIEKLKNKNNQLENDKKELLEKNEKLKHSNKEYMSLKNDNERFSRLIKEKDKKINELLENGSIEENNNWES